MHVRRLLPLAFLAASAAAAEPLVVALDYVMPEQRVDRKFRTPETIDAALAQDLARRLNRPLAAVPATSTAQPRVRITTLAADGTTPAGYVSIPVPYTSAPMAIMRTDTTIKRWEQLKGRTVCVSQGGNHVGTLAARYGAIEKIYPAPADALIAVRIGDCDATVHDSAMLEEMIRLPEWKKFSARLPAGKGRTLALLVPESDSATIAAARRVVREWGREGLPVAVMKKAVRSIAFEVYLDQDVPDCH